MAQLKASIDDDSHDALRALAYLSGRSIAELVGEAIRGYLAGHAKVAEVAELLRIRADVPDPEATP